MYVISIEVVARDVAKGLLHRARRERREQRQWILKNHPLSLLVKDLSEMASGSAWTSPAPIENCEEPGDIFESLREQGRGYRPLLVTFSQPPSKRFEEDLRSAGKRRKCRLHLHRLIGETVLIQIDDSATGDEMEHRPS
jgi:hypothetical protein